MSATVGSLSTYHAEMHPPLRGWRIMDGDTPVDIVATAAVARYDVDLLNAGRAYIDSHAMLGCRVALKLPVAV